VGDRGAGRAGAYSWSGLAAPVGKGCVSCAGGLVIGARRKNWRRARALRLATGLLATVFACGLSGGLGARQALADTLAEAMAAAYLGNPVLQGERARQRATDEQVPQALSGWRPTVILRGDGGFEQDRRRAEGSLPPPGDDFGLTTTTSGDNTPARFAIGLSQPIFRGFKTVSETERAEANVAAGQQDLLGVEQQVLLDATAAYMDVVRAREIVTLRERNVEALAEQLRGAQARFNVGEITRTDVEQARARLSRAEADLAVARANLAAAAAFYVQVIGHAPATLRYPAIPTLVPASLDEALAMANQLNPLLLSAAFNAEAARHQIDFVQADLLPSVSLEAEFRASHEPQPGTRSSQAGSVLGVLQVPLYQAGRVSSEVREAKQLASQARIQIIEAGRSVRESVVRTWNVFVSSAETIEALQAQVTANELALEGVTQEALVGTRTTLDVLDAVQELVQSQVDLANARRDRVVAAYQLIATTGRLTAPNLALAVPYYDPDGHYLKTRNRVFGVTTETVD
jgi:outer membrane protein